MKTCPSCMANYPNAYAVCPQDGTPLRETSAWEDGTVIRGKYRILKKIGQGGMGAVYMALHVAFDERRALKVISPELMSDELFVKRFKHEAIITRRLQHPNAVRVDDIDEAEDGRPFIIMEYIEGQSLKKLIQDRGALDAPRACRIIKQVCSALEAAHRLGMIHRDIKPDNIVLIDAPEGEQSKVLDFGIAKIKEARLGDVAGLTLTGTGVVIGTPQYMSPEQAMGKRGEELDGRSDLYSLGVVMYQMLTGDLPFKADTTMEMLLAHLQRPPAPIASIRPELPIPEAIANVVMRTLEKKPEMRPASAQALIEEIERAERDAARPRRSAVADQPTRLIAPDPHRIPRPAPPPPPPPPPPVPTPVSETPLEHPPAPPPTPAPRPRPATPQRPPAPVAVAPPPPKPTAWGLWASMAIIVVALGGGAWYFFARQGNVTPESYVTPAPQPVEPEKEATLEPVKPAEDVVTRPVDTPLERVEPEPSENSRTETPPVRSPGRAPVRRPAASNPLIPRLSERSEAPPAPQEPAKLAVDPKQVTGAIKMGNFFFDRGEYDSAIREYENGLRLDPTNETLQKNLVRARRAKAAEERVLQQ